MYILPFAETFYLSKAKMPLSVCTSVRLCLNSNRFSKISPPKIMGQSNERQTHPQGLFTVTHSSRGLVKPSSSIFLYLEHIIAARILGKLQKWDQALLVSVL